MSLKKIELGLVGKILALLITLNIIGDIGNIIFWWVNPESRALSLNTGYMGVLTGADAALITGTVVLAVVAASYGVALFGLIRKTPWMPLLVISISIVNRILALILYEISAAFLFWTAWTVILVVFAYLSWRRLDKPLVRLWG